MANVSSWPAVLDRELPDETAVARDACRNRRETTIIGD